MYICYNTLILLFYSVYSKNNVKRRVCPAALFYPAQPFTHTTPYPIVAACGFTSTPRPLPRTAPWKRSLMARWRPRRSLLSERPLVPAIANGGATYPGNGQIGCGRGDATLVRSWEIFPCSFPSKFGESPR